MTCCVMLSNYDCRNELNAPVGEAPLAVALGSMITTASIRQLHSQRQRPSQRQAGDVVMAEGSHAARANTRTSATSAATSTTTGTATDTSDSGSTSSADSGEADEAGEGIPVPFELRATAAAAAPQSNWQRSRLSRLTAPTSVPAIPAATFAATVSQLRGNTPPAQARGKTGARNPQRDFATFISVVSKRLPEGERQASEQLTATFTSGRLPFNSYIRALNIRLGQAKLGLLLKKFELMNQKMA